MDTCYANCLLKPVKTMIFPISNIFLIENIYSNSVFSAYLPFLFLPLQFPSFLFPLLNLFFLYL